MNDMANPLLTQLNQQMNDLQRSILRLHTDMRTKAKPNKIGMLMRVEALGREALMVDATMRELIDDLRAKAVAK